MTILKANELRIGNWANIVKSDFDLEKGNRKLEGISLHYIEMGEIEVEGVPLTEEILLKAGFILSLKWDWDKMYSKEIRLWEDENIMKINYYVIDGKNYFTTSICLLEHEYLYNGGKLENITEANIDKEVTIQEFNYVHELQNIHHSLTQEELEIEL